MKISKELMNEVKGIMVNWLTKEYGETFVQSIENQDYQSGYAVFIQTAENVADMEMERFFEDAYDEFIEDEHECLQSFVENFIKTATEEECIDFDSYKDLVADNDLDDFGVLDEITIAKIKCKLLKNIAKELLDSNYQATDDHTVTCNGKSYTGTLFNNDECWHSNTEMYGYLITETELIYFIFDVSEEIATGCEDYDLDWDKAVDCSFKDISDWE